MDTFEIPSLAGIEPGTKVCEAVTSSLSQTSRRILYNVKDVGGETDVRKKLVLEFNTRSIYGAFKAYIHSQPGARPV